ncbi:MAG: hypothetical protein WD896_01800 [Parcubacteria group bacterium]
MNEEERSKIEGLNDTLYSRTRYRNPLDKRSPVKEVELPDVENKWQTPELDEMLQHERIPPKISPLMKKIFISALVFFIAAMGVAGFVFLGGANFVSSKNVDIGVLGPTAVSAGEILELGVTISNTNNADLEFANLSIQYPQGSRSPDNTAESLTYMKEDLGVIKAGNEAVRNVRMVLLGSSGEIKEIKLSVEYKVRGSNATFFKDKVFEVSIGNAPITLTVESPRSTTSGENFTTVVSIVLNSTEILKDVVLKAEYPYGYSVTSAIPGAVIDNNLWVLGDLSPGDKKTISIRGQLLGENGEERTFRFYAGVSDGSAANPNLKILIASHLDTVAIDRPSIGLEVLFNGENTSTYIAPVARPISVYIRYQNNLRDRLLNPRLEVGLAGASLDKLSVSTGGDGVYDVASSKAIWNLGNTSGSSELAPGEGGQVILRFASLPSTSLSANNNDIILNLLLTGVPVSSVGQGPVSVTETRIVRISSQVNFSTKALRSLGPFANHGPIPPKVGEATTYAVVFNVGNTQGDLVDVKVTARLGQGVSWLGAQSFTSENISYASSTNTVSWELGDVSSGAGFSSEARELAFQVSLTPFLGQVGTGPNLITDIVFAGRDTLTGNTLRVNNPPLTTRLLADPAFIQGDDIVVNK